MTLLYRKARLEDSDLLLRWRNDTTTREQSLQSAEVSPEEHRDWYAAALRREDLQIFLAEREGLAIGMVRLEKRGAEWELSWNLAPEARGKGWGKQLVAGATALRAENLMARIKRQNLVSEAVARSAGFVFIEEKDGVGTWRLARI